MSGPGEGPCRVVRGATLALVCCGLPLLGHNPDRILNRGSIIGLMILVLVGVGLRLAVRQVSWLSLAGMIIAGQLAMHALLKVTVDRRDPEQVWTYHAHFPPVGWAFGAQGTARMLATHLVLDLLVAAVLYGFESNLWTWFRIAALRVLCPMPSPALPITPDTPTLPPVPDEPTFRPLLLVSASGRRGPPGLSTA